MIGIPIILVDVVQFVNTLARQNKKNFLFAAKQKVKKNTCIVFQRTGFLE